MDPRKLLRIVGFVLTFVFFLCSFSLPAKATLVIDASSPATVKSNAATLTTASFTPPANSVLYIAVFLRSEASPAGRNNSVSSITDNLGYHLTYTLQGQYGTVNTDDGLVYLYTAVATTSQAMTVSVTQASTVSTARDAMLRVVVINGARLSGPVGQIGGGRGVTGVVSDTYTSSAHGSWGWLMTADWSAGAVPTPGTGQETDDSYNVASKITDSLIKRTTTTPTAGTSVTMDTTAPVSGSQIAHLYFEMYPDPDLGYTTFASSTNFFVNHTMLGIAGGNPTYTFSTSTTFKLLSAAQQQQTGIGTSTSSTFGLLSGFLRSLYVSPSPTYTQIHYHWRNDDGSEAAATSKTSGVQDTDITSLAKSTGVRLRFEVANKGGTKVGYSTQQFRLEYGLKSTTCADIGSWTDVGAVAGDWDMFDSSSLTEGGNTTNIAAGIGGVVDGNHTFLTPNGGIKDTSSTVSAINLTSEQFIELEYSIQALSAATDGGAYCFRVTNAGNPTNYSYTVYPQATLAAGGGYLYFSVDGTTEGFGTVTPGTVAATSSILTVRTDNSTGFFVTVRRSDATGTMSSSGTYIPDKTAWVPGANTSLAGNATASTTEPLTLQFRVRQAGTDGANYSSAWWGTADTTVAALFAGFPASNQNIIDRSSSAVSTTTAYVLYNLNVPTTQKTGAYSGDIIYTVTTNI